MPEASSWPEPIIERSSHRNSHQKTRKGESTKTVSSSCLRVYAGFALSRPESPRSFPGVKRRRLMFQRVRSICFAFPCRTSDQQFRSTSPSTLPPTANRLGRSLSEACQKLSIRIELSVEIACVTHQICSSLLEEESGLVQLCKWLKSCLCLTQETEPFIRASFQVPAKTCDESFLPVRQPRSLRPRAHLRVLQLLDR